MRAAAREASLQAMPSHFELFGLAPAFALETEALERSYRDIQSRVHPDRYAAASDESGAPRCSGPRASTRPTAR